MKTTFCLASLLLFAFGLRADTNPVFKCQVKVVNAQGRPVSGAVVERFLRKMLVPGDPLPPDGRDTTDSNGIVSLTTTNHSYYAGFANPSLLEIEGLPRGRRYSVNASAKGFGQDTKTVEASDSATNRVELEILQLVLANLKIAGVVLDADDKPVPGAFINGYGNPKQAQVNGQTDSKGRFSFGHICPGTINLSANHPRGGASGTVSAEAGDTNITLRLDSQEAVLGLPNSNSGRKINGTVLDTNGKPAPKVVVSLYPYFSYVQKKTDEAGRFVLSPDPNQPNGIGNQRVIVARDTDRELAATLDLEEDATNVTLHLAPAFTLVGHAVNINGKPLAKAQAQLLFRTDRMSSTLGSSVRADEEGRFEIRGSRPTGDSASPSPPKATAKTPITPIPAKAEIGVSNSTPSSSWSPTSASRASCWMPTTNRSRAPGFTATATNRPARAARAIPRAVSSSRTSAPAPSASPPIPKPVVSAAPRPRRATPMSRFTSGTRASGAPPHQPSPRCAANRYPILPTPAWMPPPRRRIRPSWPCSSMPNNARAAASCASSATRPRPSRKKASPSSSSIPAKWPRMPSPRGSRSARRLSRSPGSNKIREKPAPLGAPGLSPGSSSPTSPTASLPRGLPLTTSTPSSARSNDSRFHEDVPYSYTAGPETSKYSAVDGLRMAAKLR